MEKESNVFIQKDSITGRKLINPLNKKNLSEWEMDNIFLDLWEV